MSYDQTESIASVSISEYDRSDGPVKREPEVRAEMFSLATSLDKVEKVVMVLTERLRTVTRGDDQVQANGGPEVDSISQCELGNEIRGATRRVHKLEKLIADLTARLEV